MIYDRIDIIIDELFIHFDWDNEQFNAFKIWAWGENHSSLVISDTPAAWNERHIDIFDAGKECMKIELFRMAYAYSKYNGS